MAKKTKITKEEVEEKVAIKKDSLMSKLAEKSATPPAIGEVVEGNVIGVEKACVYIDLSPYGTGIIFGKEFINTRDVIKKINIGDKVAAKIVDIGDGNENGYFELSLKEARQAMVWSEAEESIKNKTVLELPIVEANKGGLLINWQGLKGFLPASQLKTEHYPRIVDGDKDKILDELKKLIGQKIAVTIITALPKEGKLIFSEKTVEKNSKQKMTDKYKVGDICQGEITGIVDFGLFVRLEDGLEGLVHISEIDWTLVENPRTLYKVGEKVSVKVIDIKDGKVSLSLKALKENPWLEGEKKYKKNDEVEGVVIKFNKHGALASIEEGISGLVHISEFGSEAKMKEKLEFGKSYTFKIILFDAKNQKMGLSFTDKEKK